MLRSLQEVVCKLLSLEFVVVCSVLDPVQAKEGIRVHPLHSLEGRQHLAVVETGRSPNEVVSWCAHHGRPDHHRLLVLGLLVVHVGPDPERTLVVGAHIIARYEFLPILIVVRFSCLREVVVGPLDGVVVDLSAPVAYLIESVEVWSGCAGMLLNSLAGGDLSLHLGGSDRVVTSIKLVKLAIDILRHGNRVKLAAGYSRVATGVDLRKVDWVD